MERQQRTIGIHDKNIKYRMCIDYKMIYAEKIALLFQFQPIEIYY